MLPHENVVRLQCIQCKLFHNTYDIFCSVAGAISCLQRPLRLDLRGMTSLPLSAKYFQLYLQQTLQGNEKRTFFFISTLFLNVGSLYSQSHKCLSESFFMFFFIFFMCSTVKPTMTPLPFPSKYESSTPQRHSNVHFRFCVSFFNKV